AASPSRDAPAAPAPLAPMVAGHHPSAGFTGVVLCGGRSRRFSPTVDKAMVEVDGVPMARRVAHALRAAGATGVVAVGGEREAAEALGLRWRADEVPQEGPVGGIVSAADLAGGAPWCSPPAICPACRPTSWAACTTTCS